MKKTTNLIFVLLFFSKVAIAAVGLGSLPLTDIGLGSMHRCGVSEGKVYCSGNGGFGQLGNGHKLNSYDAERVKGIPDTILGVRASRLYSCAWSQFHVYCWGLVPGYKLETKAIEVYTSPITFIKKVYLSARGMCFELQNGKLDCLGSVGDLPLKQFPLQEVDEVGLGEQHLCIRKKDSIFCAGENDFGQLGFSPLLKRSPQFVHLAFPKGFHPEHLVVGSNHSCVLGASVEEGSPIYCWGRNTSGQVGVNRYDQKIWIPTPVPFSEKGLPPITALALSESHSCLVRGRLLYCWGDNQKGEVNPKDILIPKRTYWSPIGISEELPMNSVLSLGTGATCLILGRELKCMGVFIL